MNCISIIVPGYNEGEKIRDSLLAVRDEISKFAKNYEILFVNDGSTDNTLEFAKKAACENVKILSYSGNRGKGAAIKYGFSRTICRTIVFLDADLDIDPMQIRTLTVAIERGADIAIFSKNHPLSQTDFPLFRHLLSRAYYAFTKILFRLPLSDTQTGCKAFRREVLEKILPAVYTRAFAFDLELLSYANDFGYKIEEFPVKIRFGRKYSRLRLKNIIRMFLDTIIAFYRLNVKKIHRW